MRPVTCIFLASLLATLVICSSPKESDYQEQKRAAFISKDTDVTMFKNLMSNGKRVVAQKKKNYLNFFPVKEDELRDENEKSVNEENNKVLEKRVLDLEGLPEEMKIAIQSLRNPIHTQKKAWPKEAKLVPTKEKKNKRSRIKKLPKRMGYTDLDLEGIPEEMKIAIQSVKEQQAQYGHDKSGNLMY